jgi:hypothetical protein
VALWSTLLEQIPTAVGSGVTAFFGAYARFKARHASLEKGNRLLKEKVDTQGQGWRLEFNTFKEEFDHYKELADKVEEVRKEERASHPDPFEGFNGDLRRIREDIDKLKTRAGRYTRNDDFVAFVRSQEEQWRKLERTLGQLEGQLGQLLKKGNL